MRAHISKSSRWWWRSMRTHEVDTPPPEHNGDPRPAHALDVYDQLRLPRTLNYPSTDLAGMFAQSARRFPDAPALCFGDDCWSYAALAGEADRIAAGLAQLGVRPGDHVLMTLPNSPDFVRCFMAVQKLGAVVVNAGPLMGADDLRALLRLTMPRAVIALDLQASSLEPARRDLHDTIWLWSSLQSYQPLLKRMGYRVKRWQVREQLAGHEDQTSVEELLDSAPSRPPTVAPSPDDVAVLQPTGGTTGTLKVAELTHRSLLSNAVQLSAWASLRQGQERVFAVLPMFHVYGLTMSLLLPICNASTILPMPRFELGAMLTLLRDHRPTLLPIVPAIASVLCDELERSSDEAVLDVLRRCVALSGAAPLPDVTAERFEQLTGNRLIQGYGLTEASPVTHANPLAAPRPGSIGLAMPDTKVRIADLEDPTRDAAPGEPGELVVRGPQLMRGYYRNAQATAHMLRKGADGEIWLHTGDVARVDEAGYVYLIDRRKHMINHAGLKVWPAKVEQVLLSHDDVKDAAVVGRADPVHTEAVTAIVVPKPAVDTGQLVDVLRSLCRAHLAAYEVPSRFEFVQQLPRSPLGKLMKYRLAPASDDTPKAGDDTAVAEQAPAHEEHSP